MISKGEPTPNGKSLLLSSRFRMKLLVPSAPPGIKDLPAQRGPQAQLDLALRDLPVRPAQSAPPAPPARLSSALLDYLDPQAPSARAAHKAQSGLLGQRGLQDLKDRPALLALPDRLARA